MPASLASQPASILAKVACHCTVDWCRPVDGESMLSWWHVHVEERHDWLKKPRRKMYLIKAIDDDTAARQGLKLFENEFSDPLLVFH
jgi:hypothetical protein